MVKGKAFEYEDREVYRRLQEIALRQGYDTFAVVFINMYEHHVVRPAKNISVLEEAHLKEVVNTL